MRERQPHVTVAMITYNHEKFVGDAVRSILAQTYRDFELVIVDDGSTDGTAEVIRGLHDERIVCLRQENQGPSEARNTALRVARGTLIAQMSGDDVAEPARLERQLAQHRERPNSVIFSHCTFIGDDSRATDGARWEKLTNRSNWTRDATLRYLYLDGNCFLAPSALAARSAFEAVGPYNPVMLQLQDYDMWVRFLLKGYEPHIVQEPLMQHRIRASGANLSASKPESRIRSHFEKQRVLREFLTINRAGRVVEIFPEAASLGYPLDDDLVPFLLVMIGLKAEPQRNVLQTFAADMLMELMENPATRKLLSEKAGFHLPDLFRILGQVDPFDAERLRRRVGSVQKQLNDLIESRTWRVARRLRGLTSGLIGRH
ncbi:MAG: glycosyltransferase [Betaproteobacteria bacterium]|nr:MAG: glycosyltransferase [Betaproteobacteria bacterium]